jgi:hypothetical protein
MLSQGDEMRVRFWPIADVGVADTLGLAPFCQDQLDP